MKKCSLLGIPVFYTFHMFWSDIIVISDAFKTNVKVLCANNMRWEDALRLYVESTNKNLE